MPEESPRPVERIAAGGQELAIILRTDYEPATIEFLTGPEHSLQLGTMCRPEGHVIVPHVHKRARRTVEYTYEVLFIVRGRVEITFFTPEREIVAVRELATGDCVMLLHGGHGFRVVEDCKMIEVKQGPYSGADFDKFRFET